VTDQQRAEFAHTQGSGLSRRTVVRTAAKSAWAAPVIVVMAGAPAVAASGVDLDVTSLTADRPTLSTSVDGAFTVLNSGAPASDIQVLVSVTPSGLNTALYLGEVGGTGGFAAGTPTMTGQGFQVVFTRAATLATGATASCTFSFTQATGGGSLAAQVTVPADANNNTAGASY
jgi:hypothetical protein